MKSPVLAANSFKNWLAKRSSDRAFSPVWGPQLGRIKADHLRAQDKKTILKIIADEIVDDGVIVEPIAPIVTRRRIPQVDRTCARRTAAIAIIRRRRNVKLIELYDAWRAAEIAIDARFFDPKSPPSRSLFVTQSLDASRSKLVTKGKEKKTKHEAPSITPRRRL